MVQAHAELEKAGGDVAPDTDQSLRKHLLWLLRGGHAHTSFDKAVASLPPRLRGSKPPGLPYSPWMLLEHMRLSQWDIVEFSRNPAHISPTWPQGYWPSSPVPSAPASWQRGVAAWRKDLRTMMALVRNPKIDLHARLPWGDGQTVLREALLVADHNAYHIGQLIAVRRVLGAWRD